MQDKGLAAPCGIYCGTCEYLGERCSGCGNIQGRPFWTEIFNLEVCPVYGCCSGQKQIEHCGLCEDYPCEIVVSLREPSMTDQEHKQSLKDKGQALTRRKEIGTEAWLLEMKG